MKIVDEMLKNALNEDIGPGDYSSLASVAKNATRKAKLLVKDEGIIAGIALAKRIMEIYDPNLKMDPPIPPQMA